MTYSARPSPTLISLLQQRGETQPELPAYIFLADGETEQSRLTFAALESAARSLAATLQELQPTGERALLLYPPGLEFVTAFLGCLCAGIVAVPAYSPRSHRGLPRLLSIVEDSRPSLVLGTTMSVGLARELLGTHAVLAGATWLATDVPLDRSGDWRAPRLDPATIAFLQYTSGSTAAPKGVMVTHRNLLHNEEMIRRAFGQTAESVIVGWLPVYHDMGLIGNVLQPLYVGARCILMSPVAFLQRPRRWLEAITRYRATTSGGPDSAYEICVEKIGAEERAGLDLASWRVAFDGAEPIRARTLDRFATAFAPCGFRRAAFYPCYGLAEATLFVSGGALEAEPVVRSFRPDKLEQGEVVPTDGGRALLGCGHAWAGQEITIADPATVERAAPGRVGEIWVAGPSVAGGYWNRPEDTARDFRARLAGEPESGPFLRTGDLGFVAGGELFVAGRQKDLIILRGRNHYPQDIELTAQRAHPVLRLGGGAAFAIDRLGKERLVVVHEIERRAADVDPVTVAAAIRQAVAEEHEAQVYEVVLLRAGTIPKTSSGKIQRFACRAAYLTGELEAIGASSLADAESASAAGPERAEPLPRREDLLALETSRRREHLGTWLRGRAAQALSVPAERVVLDLPLTAQGLDSLSAIELQQVIERCLGNSPSLAVLLGGATVASIAAELGEMLTPETASAAASSSPAPAEEELSSGQQALWFLQRLAPQSAAHHIIAAMRVLGDLDVKALRRSFQELVDRHPALRTTFHDRRGQPIRHVAEVMAFDFVATAVGSPEESMTWLRREALRPFDLECGPLLRVGIVRLGAREHAMVLAVHHLVADFWSLAVLSTELAALYEHGTGALRVSLPAPSTDYAEFVRREAERLSGAEGARLWKYWRETLAGPIPVLDLPTDRPRPAILTDRGAARSLCLEASVATGLETCARGAEVTLFTVLLAAFQVLLHRYTGQEDLTVGSPAALRGSPELAGVVGYLVNPVVLRASLRSDLPFAQFLLRARQMSVGALAHRDYPFSRLAERLQPERDGSRSPLFQAMFTWRRSGGPAPAELAAFSLAETAATLRLGALTLVALPLPQPPVQFDLELSMARLGSELVAELRWKAELFDDTTGARMLGHFATLLAAAVDDPARPVGDLLLLTAPQAAQVIVEWNATAVPYPYQRGVHELFEERADRTPDRSAVTALAESLSYGELERQANRLAYHLIRLGVGPEVPVGIYLGRSVRMLVGLVGILKAGGKYLPLDPSYPAERLAYMLADANASVVLTEEALMPELARYPGHLVALDAAWLRLGGGGDERPPARCLGESAAYLIYTSGSTGLPKAVEVPHRAVVNFLSSMIRRPGIVSADVLVSVTTLSFDIAGLEIFLPLAVGARIVLASREVARDGAELARLLADSGATMMQATPATWRLLLASSWEGASGIRVLCGGEALSTDLVAALLAHSAEVWNLYGPTETTIWSAVHEVDLDGGRAGAVAIGRPIANTRLYLVDPVLHLVPVGAGGELVIGGDGVARGYRGRPDLTAAKFVPDPFSGVAGARIYRTGDLARQRVDGTVEFLGRFDHQVKVRGYRIELGEIEAHLAAHPKVRQAVVAARADSSGTIRLVAYVVAAESVSPPSAGELRRFLADELPEHCIPSLIQMLARLPLTPNGKVDRRALPEPEPPGRDAGGEVAPRSRLESAIAAIWTAVLGVGRVGIHDNFFDLGGHSLLVAQVHSRLRATLECDLSMLDLFRYPTVASLARHLGDDDPAPAAVAAPATLATTNRAVAVIGMAGRFPGARDVAELWRRVSNGEECITFFGDEELRLEGVPAELLSDASYVKAGGVLADADRFDAAFFGFSPREAELMDPQHRVFLECAWEALEHAGYDSSRYSGRVGIYAGVGVNTYLHHTGVERLQSTAGRYQAFIANDKDFVPTRVSYKLDLRGPSIDVQTACSSSLVAIHLACQALLAGDCDMALAGGVSIRVPQREGCRFEVGGITSPDGHCRAFDAGAEGTVFGSGVGLVLLKRLAPAVADRDTLYAVIRGSAVNNDGADKIGYTAPGIAGQAQVIAAALAAAGVEPESIGYVETHGTGTALGDPIEIAALTEAFAQTRRRGYCAVGSVKTNVGHLDTAAGITGLLKTIEALRHHALPPSLHFERPNPKIDFAATPFYVSSRLANWPSGDTPRRAGVSSFGIGGTNAHVVVEEAPADEAATPSRQWQLLVLSARTRSALDTATRNLAAVLRVEPPPHLPDVAYTLQVGRRPFGQRRALICRDPAEAATAFADLDPDRLLVGAAETGDQGVVFLFSGQGVQYVGMGADLYDSEPTFRREIDLCADLLEPHLGLDLRRVLYPPAGKERKAECQLAETALTQAALFAVEYALARCWMEWGVQPRAMLGHSVGEYVAACLAGVFTLTDALALVAARGRLMQSLPAGAMLALELPETEAMQLLGEELSLAAVNGPDATTVSGPTSAVVALERLCEARGIRHRRLHTSHAFHSAMMDAILPTFAAEVARVRRQPPHRRYLSNLTGTWATAAETMDPEYWSRHLRGTVRFAAGLGELLAEPDSILLELGPGHTLATLARRAGHKAVSCLRHPRDAQPDQAVLLRALGQLWLQGVSIDWTAFWGDERRRRVPLPTYPFERQRYWLDRERWNEPGDRLGFRQHPRDWLYAPLWQQTVPLPRRAPGPGSAWLLLADEAGLAERLADRLRADGAQATMVAAGECFARLGEGAYVVDPAHREDYETLVGDLAEQGRSPACIVHAWNVVSPTAPLSLDGRDTPLASWREARVRAFDSLIHLAQALARHRCETRISVLSNNLHQVAAETFFCPHKALLLGPVQVIPQEMPELFCQSIDLVLAAPGSGAEAAVLDDLLAELNGPAERPAPVVALRGGTRYVRGFGPVPVAPAAELPTRLRRGGVYLVTGGFGGIGMTLARELAERAAAKLVLTGRSGVPPRESWAEWRTACGDDNPVSRRIRAVQDLESLGAEVLALAADVTDAAAMKDALSQVERRFGTLHGVIHAAGLAGGGILQWKTAETAHDVMAPKVLGTLVLHDLLRDLSLDFFLLCSSINSVVGGFGQSDYCAANAFLDAFAQATGHGTTISVSWDRWDGIGMAARDVSSLAPWRQGPSSPSEHPLLGSRVSDGAERVTYLAEFRVERQWVLSEHRIAGHPTVPGTAFLEMARAAFAPLAAGPVELREVAFLAPLAVLEGEGREVSTVLERSGEGWEFRVMSRAVGGPSEAPWDEHARGRIGVCGELASTPRDVAGILAVCGRQVTSRPADAAEFLVTGPRWQSLKRLHLGQGESLAVFELGAEFAAELDILPLHPALLDVATGAVQLLGAGRYLPIAYERLVVRGPLPREGFSHLRLREAAAGGGILSCDLSVLDTAGRVLVDIAGFSMRRLEEETIGRLQAAVRRPAPSPAAAVAVMDGGIAPREGVEVFHRILDGIPLAHVVVSTRALDAVIAAVTHAAPPAPPALPDRLAGGAAHARPELSSSFAAPADDLEREVAAVWAEVLGIDRIGVRDNFFELGGTSLTGIQLVSELKRRLGLDLSMVSIFEAPTVAALVRYLQPERVRGSAFEHSRSRADKKRSALRQARRRLA